MYCIEKRLVVSSSTTKLIAISIRVGLDYDKSLLKVTFAAFVYLLPTNLENIDPLVYSLICK